jgi:glycosyltransferase involved in cell wall biosynthesis
MICAAAEPCDRGGGKQAEVPPKFSICIPIRNESEWLGNAIESVLAQTYGDFELVIGDNASDDGIDKVVAEFDDPRIVHNRFDELVLVNESWNRTVALCRSAWVVPMSADDRMRPHCLERMVEMLDAHAGAEPVMLCGSVSRVDPQGRPDDIGMDGERPVRPIPYRSIRPGLHDARSWLLANAAPGLSPWMVGGVAFRRTTLDQSGFFRADMELCADLELMMRLPVYGPVVWTDEALLEYTVRGGSTTQGYVRRDLERNRPTTMNERAWLAVLTLHEDRREIGDDELAVIKTGIARQLLQRALWQRTFDAGQGRGAALRDVVRAARYSSAALASPVQIGVAIGAILAPRWALRKVTDLGHRYGIILV